MAFGTDVKGEVAFSVSPYEKFLIITKDATYKVVGIDNKTFVDVDALYIDLFDEKRLFTLIYTDLETQTPYAKKFKIEKYQTNKVYNLSPSGKGKIEYLGDNAKEKVKILYIKNQNKRSTKRF